MGAYLFLCSAQNRTHLRDNVRADLQEYYSCKGFVYLVCKAQRGIAVVRRYTWRLVQTLKPYPNFWPAHRIPRPLLCRISSARYTRLDLLAMRDIASRKTVINCFSLALRTCLALGIQSLLITLVVLYARSISSPANIPPLAVCTKTYHIEAPPKVLLFFFLSVVDPYASHETFPIQQIFATCFSKKQPSSNVLTLK